MKKIDFHIHTIVSDRDPHSDSEFDVAKFKEYVDSLSIDAVAITNHNLFNLAQFKEIDEALEGVAVFPGIEINFGKGHLLLIAENEDLESFNNKCALVESEYKKSGEISSTKLTEIFEDFDRYLLIPHYLKNPVVSSEALQEITPGIFVGEVSSQKRFFQSIKNPNAYSPVYFSDARITKDMEIGLYQGRQTYLNTNADPLTLGVIKLTLGDKKKVFLTNSGRQDFFQVFSDSQELSGGLNVVLGQRSSGKTHFLNRLEEIYSIDEKQIKYIRQGTLMSDSAEEFDALLKKEEGAARENYLEEFKPVVAEVSKIDIRESSYQLERYIESLKAYASDEKTHDIYSRATLYSESPFSIREDDELEELIGSVLSIKENKTYKTTINKYLTDVKLSGLLNDLVKQYKKQALENLKKTWVNELSTTISRQLNSKTATKRIEFNETDFYDIKLKLEKVKRFNAIANALKTKTTIGNKDSLGKFSIRTTAGPYVGASELKKESRYRDTSFGDAFNHYDNPIIYLEKLKEMSTLDKAELYKFFCKVSHQILNEYGKPVSGGERAEFNLLKALNDALQFEMLFIDEPESSFDNLFLKSDVNDMIKNISAEMPVVVVTHNSTVGMLLKPNYILYTKREIDGKKDTYYLFSGSPGDTAFKTADGKKTESSHKILLDTLEAGEDAYNEKKTLYDKYKKV